MVFIEEVPSKCGFLSCLFTELESYDKQIIVDEYANWLLESLKQAEEDIKQGHYYSIEEVKEYFQ